MNFERNSKNFHQDISVNFFSVCKKPVSQLLVYLLIFHTLLPLKHNTFDRITIFCLYLKDKNHSNTHTLHLFYINFTWATTKVKKHIDALPTTTITVLLQHTNKSFVGMMQTKWFFQSQYHRQRRDLFAFIFAKRNVLGWLFMNAWIHIQDAI